MTRDHDDPYDLPLGAGDPGRVRSPEPGRPDSSGGPFAWGDEEEPEPTGWDGSHRGDPDDPDPHDSPPAWTEEPRPPRRRTWLWVLLAVVVLLALLAGAAITGYLLPRPGPSVVRAAPSLVDFGAVNVGEAAAAREVTVENAGEGPLRIGEAALSGPDAGAFEISADGCTGTSLATGRTCTLVVRFRPLAAAGARASLEVPSEATNGPAVVTLLGEGAASEPALDRRRVDFPPVAAGALPPSGARPETVTLGNRGRAPLPVEQVVVQGDGAGDFRIDRDQCSGEVIGPGEECSVRVVFDPRGARGAPPEAGERSATLSFRLRDGAGTGVVGAGPVVALSGTVSAASASDPLTPPPLVAPAPSTPQRGQAGETPAPAPTPAPPPPPPPPPAELAADPGSLDFGELAVGAEGEARPVTLRNTGGSPATVDSLALAGADADAFALRDDRCSGRPLPAGASCTAGIVFRPRQEGVQRARLEVRASGLPEGGDGPPRIALSGAGATARLAVSPATVDFGEVRLESTAEREVVLSNRGRAPLPIREVSVRASSEEGGREFAVVSNGCAPGAPLAPGERCEVTVRFRPAGSGPREAALEVRHRGAGGEERVALRGTGAPIPAPRAFVDPAEVRFGSVRPGGRSDIVTVTLSNRGNARMEVGTVGLVGADAGEFQIVAGSCDGASFLVPGSECTVGVRFAPAASGPEGERRARLLLPHGAPGGRETVELSGRAGGP